MVLTDKELASFWKRVKKTSQCWCWVGVLDRQGYGRMMFRRLGKRYRAHRLSYFLFFGTIPKDLCVLHRCDNPSCVNPRHLFLGTCQDNSRDMVAKGRQVKGEMINHAKLTAKEVLEIRRRYAPRDQINSQCALAREFGVSSNLVYKIVHNRNWKHLDREV